MKYRFLLGFLLIFTGLAYGQNFTIKGKVVDSASREPLLSASVFCQNTTQGTATNKEGEFSLSLKPGGYDLIITYTGYKAKLIPISHQSDNLDLQIEMVKEEKSIEEVVIRSSAEVKDGWEKYGKFFMSNFIGATPFAAQCSLANPEVLKFYYYRRADKLKVLAEEPIIINNYALGYRQQFTLDSFLHMFKTEISSYRGYCFYQEMSGPIDSIRLWRKNREKAYMGSRLHFMHSYYDTTVTKSGFVVAMLDEEDETKFNRITNLYDSTYYNYVDSTGEADLFFPRKISITYIKRTPETEYLKQYKLPLNVGVQTSYIDLWNVITIRQNGYYYDQKDWVNSGYWSWKNLADQVPYDYSPK
jgi:hypothetical protein